MMNANKSLVNAVAVVLMSAAANTGWAVDNLEASSQTKVNGALAKKWSNTKGAGDGYNNPVDQKRVVNIGSRKSGCSNVNIGTVKPTKPGEKAPKEIIVTTKDVINVCK